MRLLSTRQINDVFLENIGHDIILEILRIGLHIFAFHLENYEFSTFSEPKYNYEQYSKLYVFFRKKLDIFFCP